MHKIKIEEKLDEILFVTFPFYYGEESLSGIKCGMTVKKCGSMRFRWNENNVNRVEKLELIKRKLNVPKKEFIPVELIHSKTVYQFSSSGENQGLLGDGIITANNMLIPTVTVADCMPLFLFDKKSGVFGVVHSGWKGTGIVEEALKLAYEKYNSCPEDFSIVIGPHIRDCCYIVNEERAAYFAEKFTPDCVTELEAGGDCYCGGRGLPLVWNNGSGKLYRLSLEKANLSVLEKCGIKNENITVVEECTCCNEFLGSNRRETAESSVTGSAIPSFTVQAAFTVLE